MAIAFDDVRKTYDGLQEKAGRVAIVRPEEVGRDWGPDGPKTRLYTRATTYIDTLTSAYGLMRWEHRKVLAGLVAQPGLMLSVAAHLDDVAALDEYIEKAKVAGLADEAADAGTAMHRVFDRLDKGESLEQLRAVIPAEYHDEMASYAAAVEGIRWESIERRIVLDNYSITGTPDRLGTFPKNSKRWNGVTFPDGRPVAGKTTVWDSKTGKIEDYNVFKMAMQLAIYARGQHYDPATGARTTHGADTKWGVIIHSPVGSGRTELRWIDLSKGWAGVLLCKQVREARNLKQHDLMYPLAPPLPSAPAAVDRKPVQSAIARAGTHLAIVSELESATTLAELIGVWELHQHSWTAELDALAAARREAIS